MLPKLLLDTVGAEACDAAAHVHVRLVDRISERVTGVPADDETSALGHERAHVADRAPDDDVDSLHRNPAARACVAVHDEQTAAARRAGGLACLSFDHHPG